MPDPSCGVKKYSVWVCEETIFAVHVRATHKKHTHTHTHADTTQAERERERERERVCVCVCVSAREKRFATCTHPLTEALFPGERMTGALARRSLG